MLAAVLRSQRAAQMSILIIRAFVKMRELLASHKDLAARVEKLEAAQKKHGSIIGILAGEIGEMKRLPNRPSAASASRPTRKHCSPLAHLTSKPKLLTPAVSERKCTREAEGS